jgi:hypothetical protein
VANVFELLSSVLTRIHKQYGHLARMLEVSYIIDFIVDEQPERLFRVVAENLRKVFEDPFGSGLCH